MEDSDYRKLLVDRFSKEEIRDLCFDLGVEYENLPGQTRAAKARELLEYLKRRDRMQALDSYLKQNRPEFLEQDDDEQLPINPPESRTSHEDGHQRSQGDPKIGWPQSKAQPDDDEADSSNKRRNQSANPFTYGDPISEPDRFFGRQHEVEQVFSRLLNPEAESSSLVGNRRIGKTSLLKYLAHPTVRREYGLDLNRFNFVYVDLQKLGHHTTPAELWSHLFEEMSNQCKDHEVKGRLYELSSSETINNRVIGSVFKLIDARKRHIVLLLDEFDLVTKNVNFDEDFFSFLRSLATQHNLSLITSSHQELIDLTHSETIRSSPFFNIFANINLGLFSEKEVQELISSSLGNSGKQFTNSEVKDVLCIAGPYPYFLQTACHFLFDAYKDGRDLDLGERLEFVKENFTTQADPHFKYFWTNSDMGEQIVLIILALIAHQPLSGRQPCTKDDLEALYSLAPETVNRLEKRALVTKELSEYALFSLAFGEWIVKELAISAGIGFGYKSFLNFSIQFLNRVRKKNWRAIILNPPAVGKMYQSLVNSWINNSRNPEKVVELLKNGSS